MRDNFDMTKYCSLRNRDITYLLLLRSMARIDQCYVQRGCERDRVVAQVDRRAVRRNLYLVESHRERPSSASTLRFSGASESAAQRGDGRRTERGVISRYIPVVRARREQRQMYRGIPKELNCSSRRDAFAAGSREICSFLLRQFDPADEIAL